MCFALAVLCQTRVKFCINTSRTVMSSYTDSIGIVNDTYLLLQIAFSPRRNNGYGLTDGEGIERLWSYLRGFSSITKEMTYGRRIDILTDALLHYGQRRLQQFGLFCFIN